MSTIDHENEARAALRMADLARNGDYWTGDRDGPAIAHAAIAQAHATLYLASRLDALLAFVEDGRGRNLLGDRP